MWDAFVRKIKLVIEDETLRNRVFFVLSALVVFRILAAIPIPGINVVELQNLLSGNQFLGLLNVFSGGGLSNMRGISPCRLRSFRRSVFLYCCVKTASCLLWIPCRCSQILWS